MKQGIVYNGRGNTVELALTEGDPLIIGKVCISDLGLVTRIVLTLGATVIDSDDVPAAFDWVSDCKRLVLKLGGQNIPPAAYKGKLILYSVDQPEGVVWSEDIAILVEEG